MSASRTSILLFVLLISCNQVYKEYEKLPFADLVWNREEIVLFYPEIADTSKTYSVLLGIRHVYGMRIRSLPVTLKIVSPTGKAITRDYTLKIQNVKGEPLASCAGDLCDLETVVDKLKFSEPGQYTFSVTQVSGNAIVGIMEFGIILKHGG